ncbi:MAG: TerC family protein [Rhodospirillaceae bacterium]
MEFAGPEFWLAVAQIILIDILLGGDNAVVIALACRNLPERQRRRGIFWGVFGAVGLRTVLTLFAVALLAVPYLKMVGGILLFWIGIKLILPENDDGGHEIAGSMSLWGAVKTIIVADFVMSLDNVIAVAAAAKDQMMLIVFGLLISIPIIVWCSQLVLKLMERFPIVIVLGGALLGYIAGDMITRDPALVDWLSAHAAWVDEYHIAGILGALMVVGVATAIAGMANAKAQRRVEVISKDEPSAG